MRITSDGKISDERFAKMTVTYEQEQKDLQSQVTILRETPTKAKTQRLNIGSFLAQVKKYTEVKELDAEIIRASVERIDVSKPENVPGTRTKKQTILIHWNFIGAVELPQKQKNPLVRHLFIGHCFKFKNIQGIQSCVLYTCLP